MIFGARFIAIVLWLAWACPHKATALEPGRTARALPAQLPADYSWAYGGDSVDSDFGKGVTCAGDVNGDGYDDLIVGSPSWKNAQAVTVGKAYLFLGSKNGLGAKPHQTLTGNEKFCQFGQVVDSAGDVNGDGYDDVLIGVPSYGYNRTSSDPGKSEGKVYLFLGSPAGMDTNAAWSVEGNQKYAYLGDCIAGLGDVNGDKYDDIAIGNSYYDGAATDCGRVLIFYGSSSGLQATANIELTGAQASGRFGYSVAGIRDVNNDTFHDLAIGEYHRNVGSLNSAGTLYIYLGTSDGLYTTTPANTIAGTAANEEVGRMVAPAGDVNHDGYDDVVMVSMFSYRVQLYYGGALGLDPSPAWNLQDNLAKFVSDRPGDWNHDGTDDLMIGSVATSNDCGQVWIYPGTAQGLLNQAIWSVVGPASPYQLGSKVGSAGDVNADGWADVYIAASEPRTFPGIHDGVVVVYYGGGAGPVDPDSDRDGMPDEWEQRHFGGLQRDGTGDLDQDGFRDRAEYVGGTVPTNALSLLRITQVSGLPQQCRVEWSAVTGRVYSIQRAGVLPGAYVTLRSNIAGAEPSVNFTDLDALNTTTGLYRVEVRLAP